MMKKKQILMKNNSSVGYASVLAAYALWGVLPIYWHALASVPPPVVLFQRVFWSLLFLALILAARGTLQQTMALLFQRNINLIVR